MRAWWLVVASASAAHAEPDRGGTWEAAAGLGVVETRAAGGVSGGYGWWIAPRVVVGGRASVLVYRREFEVQGKRIDTFGLVGPHVQVWAHDRAFVGAGVGLALSQLGGTSPRSLGADLGFEARVGFAFPRGNRSWASVVSMQGTREDGPSTIALFVSYQQW